MYAAEISAHMCDVAEETTIMNGFLGKVTVLDKDARRLDVARKPDGTAPELPRRANLLVYEVRTRAHRVPASLNSPPCQSTHTFRCLTQG